MSFREKSAWIMLTALLSGCLLYFTQIKSMSYSLGELAQPTIPIVIFFTVSLLLVAVVGHIIIAILSPKEANASSDERERKIFDRAAHLSSHVFTTGVVLSLTLYLISYDGNMLFYGAFGSLILGQLAEYVFQIYFYRAAI